MMNIKNHLLSRPIAVAYSRLTDEEKNDELENRNMSGNMEGSEETPNQSEEFESYFSQLSTSHAYPRETNGSTPVFLDRRLSMSTYGNGTSNSTSVDRFLSDVAEEMARITDPQLCRRVEWQILEVAYGALFASYKLENQNMSGNMEGSEETPNQSEQFESYSSQLSTSHTFSRETSGSTPVFPDRRPSMSTYGTSTPALRDRFLSLLGDVMADLNSIASSSRTTNL